MNGVATGLGTAAAHSADAGRAVARIPPADGDRFRLDAQLVGDELGEGAFEAGPMRRRAGNRADRAIRTDGDLPVLRPAAGDLDATGEPDADELAAGAPLGHLPREWIDVDRCQRAVERSGVVAAVVDRAARLRYGRHRAG